ncbi:MAG: glycine--tRNA ligase subunit beta, partial [Thermodesulfobacteriota bacterium]|nr:glycine--tRNA ligase subunit beta [Thermodesulfobacteriota bacterium]
LENGIKELRRLAESYLGENRIRITGDLHTFGTPRRLVLIGKAIAKKQEDIIQDISGPPQKAAYDGEGKPTKAAFGFAKKQGVSVEDLQIKETPKGEYLFIKRKIPGRTAKEVLAEMFPKLITDIPWPKSMRWGIEKFFFVRPIHWVLALFDGDIVPFEVAGIKSENKTRGHRFMKPGILEITDIQDYLGKMKDSAVIIDHEERKREVERVIIEAADSVSGSPVLDPELLSLVSDLVEFPSAVCGSFDSAFLDLPEPVLIKPMKEHQKYFSIRDHEGRLMPNFVAVNNTVAREESTVRKGHERVLRARLSDADFFFKEDRKRPLMDRLEDLKKVIYQSELGTSFDKILRFTRLAEYLSKHLMTHELDNVTLTARLCKCDLVTEMVKEFPTLQGIMGREYARLDGHPEDVCLAIYEHYLPARAGGQLPGSSLGAIVGLADRMDTITAGFVIGFEPTGTTDPFALRRHSLSIIRILENMGWDLSLKEFISMALSILSEKIEFDRHRVSIRVADFFRERYKNMMLRAGYEPDMIESVISADFDYIKELRPRIDQLKKFATESEEFESLVLTFKRVTNILKKQRGSFTVDPGLFMSTCESELWDFYENLKDDVHGFVKGGNYSEALKLMMRMKEPVDGFFDGVEILVKDNPQLRKNRLGILQSLATLFLSLADFSKFSI